MAQQRICFTLMNSSGDVKWPTQDLLLLNGLVRGCLWPNKDISSFESTQLDSKGLGQTQWDSVGLSGAQGDSVGLTGTQWNSVELSQTQWDSVKLNGTQ